MSGILGEAFSMFFESQQSQLGYLYLDVLVSEQLTLPSEVTKYPIEDGSGDISDHITQNNEELQIQGLISSSTSFGMEFGSKCYSKMIDAIDQLRQMHKERKEVTIVTGLGQYENFGFTGLTIMRNSGADKGGQWLDINAQLRQIKKVSLKKADLPPDTATKDASADGSKPSGKGGKTERRAGKSGDASQAPKTRSESVLHKKLEPTSVGKGMGLKPAAPLPTTPPTVMIHGIRS